MPRLSPALIQHARRIDPHLARLLPACRDLSSAKLELQWLREYSLERITHPSQAGLASCYIKQQEQLLAKLVSARASGRPLQYVIGTEFFGDLEIQCREKVLIPRYYNLFFWIFAMEYLEISMESGFKLIVFLNWFLLDIFRPETANWITCLAKRIRRSLHERVVHDPLSQLQLQSQLQIKILDLCTGTGCIPLLFHHVLSQQVDGKHTITPNMRSLGVDISPAAIKLANHNLNEYLKSWESKKIPVNQSSPRQTLPQLPQLDFIQSDIFSPDFYPQISTANYSTVDILVSNPPYISPTAFNHQTARSVRKFEPKLALVPQPQPQPQLPTSTAGPDSQRHHSVGDTFYPRLLEIGQDTNAKIIAFEVSDEPQALRVAKLAERQSIWQNIEIWRDAVDDGVEGSSVVECREGIRIRGSGNGRVVICSREDGSRWLRS